MAAHQLFGRTCRVTVWKQATAIGSLPPTFFENLGNGTVISDLRMQFKITKNLAKEPNTGTITITNLAEASRQAMCVKPLHVRIDAGYDGVARNLFTGDLIYGTSDLNGADWETKIQIGEGARAYAHARVSRSFSTGVRSQDVVAYCAQTMGLTLPPYIDQTPELRQALAGSFSAAGPARDVLTKVLAPYGYHWNIVGSTLQILKDDDTLGVQQAIAVNRTTGLIGSPQRTPPEKASGKATKYGSEVTFKMLLYPELQPGWAVKIDSSEIKGGVFKLIQVSHEGDTRGQNWYSNCKAVPIS